MTLRPGEAREVGPTLYDQLRDDPTPPPDALLEESYRWRGDDDIPYAVFTAAYDVFGPNVSRFIHTTVLNSPLRDPAFSEEELLAQHVGRQDTASVELGIDDSYTLAEGLGALGRVYDQDTTNLAAQTRGFRASHKRGQTLGNYQEVRARHLQDRVPDFVGAWSED